MIKQLISLGLILGFCLPAQAGVRPSDCREGSNDFVKKIEACLLVCYEGQPIEFPLGKTKSGKVITAKESGELMSVLTPLIEDGWRVIIKSSPTGEISIIVGE